MVKPKNSESRGMVGMQGEGGGGLRKNKLKQIVNQNTQ